MAKYYIIKIESLISTFTISDAGISTSFVWSLPIPNGISAGDSILGYLIDPINEFRLLFTVQDVQGTSLTLIKELETSLGVDASQLDDDLKNRLTSHTCELFEIPDVLFNRIKAGLTSRFTQDIESEEEQNGNYSDYITLLRTNHNLILTGAPGTGKTWLAKAIAREMEAVSEFVQFHPSYDYTDFVEGLRPNIKEDDSEESDGVEFVRKDGIFKRFCKQAILYSTQAGSDDPEEEVPAGSFGDILNTIKDDIKRGALEVYSPTGHLSVNSDNRIQYNREKTKKTILETNVELLFNYYVEHSTYDISTTTKEELQSLIERLTAERSRTTRTLDFTEYKWTLSELLKRKREMNERSFVRNDAPLNKPFVFIIDEINRGELSKIFGELFFAIDPGYRGEKGLVSTQYQELITDNSDIFKRGFYVPENVYIIGTMNDIDRSVESMDFAIRRRFAWREVSAEQSAENMGLSDEVKARMNKVNQAIHECDLTPAYYIGGAYFLKLKGNDYESLWNNHIKGLVEEYFRGNPDGPDYVERIRKALVEV